MKTKKSLKIAFVLDVFDNSSNGGAISAQRFVNILKKRHQVTVVTTGDPGDGKVIMDYFYVPIAKPIMQRMKFVFAMPDRKKLMETFRRVDLVHVQFPFYLGMKAVKIANEMGVPVVSGFHVQPENILYNIGVPSKILTDRLYRFFVKRVYNGTRAVVCPSRFAQKQLLRYGLTAPSHVISNGIVNTFRPMKVSRDPRLKNRFIILSVGRLAKDKRHEVLIRAISRSRHRDEIQLIVTGEGPMKERLIEMGRMLPNEPFFLYLPLKELIRLYNTADLYVHPSEVELESMSVLEAIACGLPPLISDSKISASGQFAIDDRFLFKSNDVEDLTAKMDYWIEHRRELSQARKKYIEFSKQYHIEESVRRLENIYYDVLAK